jgi:hypothetical protein
VKLTGFSPGNGPSALILSYILHGHIPSYDSSSPHPDPILHEKLHQSAHELLDFDINFLTEHFFGSRFSYSTQALPVNVILDTLVRPLGETEDGLKKTCLRWKHQPSRAIPHIVVGQTAVAGGQWSNSAVEASWDIGTLSYAGMISLPGYGFDEYYIDQNGHPMPTFLRPSRLAVANYLAAYPDKVGISDSIYNGQEIWGVSRKDEGFYIASHDIHCRNLILASGIFSKVIPPRPLLQPLAALGCQPDKTYSEPFLVIGSGFSAADMIISSPPEQKILHIYKWDPSRSPSPLKGCHQHAYPEYAGVYRRMKLSALAASRAKDKTSKLVRPASAFESSRDWEATYEGLPNTEVIGVQVAEGGTYATITLRTANGEELQRRVGGLAYMVGRRGSLSYLSPTLLKEVLPKCYSLADDKEPVALSGQTLREKANDDLEVAPHVFIIGSLTGDSLIRFAYGGCAYAAGRIMQYSSASCPNGSSTPKKTRTNGAVMACLTAYQTPTSSPRIPAMAGLDGHETSPLNLAQKGDISLDRRERF